MNSGIIEVREECIHHGLLAVSNKETGEYWNQNSEDVETFCCCTRTCSSAVKRWRIPKKYSNLGSPKDLECKDNILVACEPEVKASQSIEINEPEMETSAQVLVASVPLLSVQLFFLKEQDGLLFVLRFLFGLLMLLAPGFFVPIIFTLRQMRHFLGHCHNEECPNLTTKKGKYQSPLFHVPRFICRFCRDQRNAEKIFDLHSQLKTAKMQSFSK